jgi:hypothetical protein
MARVKGFAQGRESRTNNRTQPFDDSSHSVGNVTFRSRASPADVDLFLSNHAAVYFERRVKDILRGLHHECRWGRIASLLSYGSTKSSFTARGCDVNSLTRRGTKTRSGQSGTAPPAALLALRTAFRNRGRHRTRPVKVLWPGYTRAALLTEEPGFQHHHRKVPHELAAGDQHD